MRGDAVLKSRYAGVPEADGKHWGTKHNGGYRDQPRPGGSGPYVSMHRELGTVHGSQVTSKMMTW